jgi:hypothetical protein
MKIHPKPSQETTTLHEPHENPKKFQAGFSLSEFFFLCGVLKSSSMLFSFSFNCFNEPHGVEFRSLVEGKVKKK